ncbi:MAG TPA: hypothetical protein VMR45_03845 [Patescibacteria group bacterium]|nr:hypothetical protein [Patescibacteria group bacterium]
MSAGDIKAVVAAQAQRGLEASTALVESDQVRTRLGALLLAMNVSLDAFLGEVRTETNDLRSALFEPHELFFQIAGKIGELGSDQPLAAQAAAQYTEASARLLEDSTAVSGSLGPKSAIYATAAALSAALKTAGEAMTGGTTTDSESLAQQALDLAAEGQASLVQYGQSLG